MSGALTASKEPDASRRGEPAEMVLPLLVLKHVRNWNDATLECEVRST
jgi:hypothetical protein